MPEASLGVILLSHTPEPEKVCAAAARQCYKNVGSADLMNGDTAILEHVIKSGHHSVIEHASFTFAVEGISRACSHQLVRHRLASYSQQSQRYVDEKNFRYIVPESVKADKALVEKFLNFMESSASTYSELVEAGMPKEDARFVLPNACETRIVITMNARELMHFFEKRLCTRAQWEIRAMARLMLEECIRVAPVIFSYAGPTCETEKICKEASSCGKWKSIGARRLET